MEFGRVFRMISAEGQVGGELMGNTGGLKSREASSDSHGKLFPGLGGEALPDAGATTLTGVAAEVPLGLGAEVSVAEGQTTD